MVHTRATFADAAAQYPRYIEQDRGRKPSTLRGYRSAIEAHLLPAFGEMPVEDVTTTAIEQWLAGSTIRVRASYYLGQLTTPKSGGVRAVPMAPDVAAALAQLGRREDWVGDDDVADAIDQTTSALEGHKLLFATQVHEVVNPDSLAEVINRFQWSSMKVYDINGQDKTTAYCSGRAAGLYSARAPIA